MDYLPQIIKIATQAGEILSSHFYSAFTHSITTKSDQSPVTQADIASNNFITAELLKLNADIPVLSEENSIPDFSVRRTWKQYWLIDPLDGTRGFISKSPEFCVNIALIENNEAVIGVIYSPIEKVCYFAEKNKGAFFIDTDQSVKPIKTQTDNANLLRFLCGHTDRAIQYKKALEKIANQVKITQMNSALKFGLIAKADADLYVRFGPTCEWDTAAGQCILTEAGGAVVDFQGNPLQYNAKESILNSSFIALGDKNRLQSISNFIKER